ncbi:hypothetical protein ACSSS7_007392 [Eimeria intestinalis]
MVGAEQASRARTAAAAVKDQHQVPAPRAGVKNTRSCAFLAYAENRKPGASCAPDARGARRLVCQTAGRWPLRVRAGLMNGGAHAADTTKLAGPAPTKSRVTTPGSRGLPAYRRPGDFPYSEGWPVPGQLQRVPSAWIWVLAARGPRRGAPALACQFPRAASKVCSRATAARAYGTSSGPLAHEFQGSRASAEGACGAGSGTLARVLQVLACPRAAPETRSRRPPPQARRAPAPACQDPAPATKAEALCALPLRSGASPWGLAKVRVGGRGAEPGCTGVQPRR